MRRLIKLLATLAALALLAAVGGLLYFHTAYPDVPPPEAVTLPSSPEALARGRYLAEHVAVCTDCHSERDFSRFAGPVRRETLGQGGARFDRVNDGVPGTIHSPNITPAGIGAYSDGELLRAVTTGVARDGRAMFPLMPYANYGQIDQDDVLAMLAYVRTLAPVEHEVPARSLEFPVNLIVRTMPRAANFQRRPPADDQVALGRYLATVASCTDCHTPMDDRGQRLPGMEFAGGMTFRQAGTGYRSVSANITPHALTGIGQWTEEQFVNKFKAFEAEDNHVLSDVEQRQNSMMPWKQYAGMTREDLAAIFAYLRAQKPVLNGINSFPDARPGR